MTRTRLLGLIGGLVLLTSSGCCWWADKWCPQSHPAAAYPSYPAPQCCPCQPYAPAACAPGPAANYPAWTPAAAPAPQCGCPR